MKFSFPFFQRAQHEEFIQSKFLSTSLIIGHLNTFAIYPWWYVLVTLEVSSRVGTCIILLLFSVLHHAQHITLQLGRLSLPQCSGVTPVTWQCLGKRCTCKAEVQGGCWNAWLCSCCELGELRSAACFAEPCAARIGLCFLFVVFPYCFYWIIQSFILPLDLLAV